MAYRTYTVEVEYDIGNLVHIRSDKQPWPLFSFSSSVLVYYKNGNYNLDFDSAVFDPKPNSGLLKRREEILSELEECSEFQHFLKDANKNPNSCLKKRVDINADNGIPDSILFPERGASLRKVRR